MPYINPFIFVTVEGTATDVVAVMRKLFVLYEALAKTDRLSAMVFSTAQSEDEAVKQGFGAWKDFDGVWFEYDVTDEADLANPRIRPDLPPCYTPAIKTSDSTIN